MDGRYLCAGEFRERVVGEDKWISCNFVDITKPFHNPQTGRPKATIGAIWHVWRREDLGKLTEFLRRPDVRAAIPYKYVLPLLSHVPSTLFPAARSSLCVTHTNPPHLLHPQGP